MSITIDGSLNTIVGSGTYTIASPTMSTPKCTTTIGVGGATPATSGAGITFPATQSASSNANTLDDYEEGSWTPVLTATSGTATSYSLQEGSYTKIGNTVFARFWVDTADKGTLSGDLKISGLPFSPSVVGGVVSFNDFHTGSLVITTVFGYPSGTTIILKVIKTASTESVNLTAADVGTSFPETYGMAIYQV